MSDLREYWDRRYAAGGISGAGSVGALRAWKHQVIRSCADPAGPVLDVGCGDLSFWHDCLPEAYTGLDFSTTIIARNQRRYPDRHWICSPASVRPPVTAPVVTCLDMLFHILDEGEYRRTLATLCACSERWIFVYTWYTNPIPALLWRIRLDLLRAFRIRGLIATFFDTSTNCGGSGSSTTSTNTGPRSSPTTSALRRRSPPSSTRWNGGWPGGPMP